MDQCFSVKCVDRSKVSFSLMAGEMTTGGNERRNVVPNPIASVCGFVTGVSGPENNMAPNARVRH